MHGRYPLPHEGALSESPKEIGKEIRKPRAFGGMVGGEPKALSTMGACSFRSARTCLNELRVPRYPPWELLPEPAYPHATPLDGVEVPRASTG